MRRLIPFALAVAAPAWAQTGAVRGVVVDSATSMPLEGAEVTLVGSARWVLTDPRGRFLLDSLSPGPARISIRRMSYAPKTRDVIVAADTTYLTPVALRQLCADSLDDTAIHT